MAEIALTPLGNRLFQVRVREAGRETAHDVSVPERLPNGLELGGDDLERIVRESFAFLLERERASSILARFSLSDIARYYPAYPDEIVRRLS